MHIMKLTVTLLAGFLVLGIALPTAAQTVPIDSSTVDLIESHLNKALVKLNRLNVLKAQDHINQALNLLPSAVSEPPGGFVFSMPFEWSQSSGPMPFQVVAMLGDGTPQPSWTGSVVISMLAYGQIVDLYDENMVPLASTLTPRFTAEWKGYAMLRTSTGQTQDLGLKATDQVTGIAGGSHAVRWFVP